MNRSLKKDQKQDSSKNKNNTQNNSQISKGQNNQEHNSQQFSKFNQSKLWTKNQYQYYQVNQNVAKALEIRRKDHDQLLDLITEKDHESDEELLHSKSNIRTKTVQTRDSGKLDIVLLILGMIALGFTLIVVKEIQKSANYNVNFLQVSFIQGFFLVVFNFFTPRFLFGDDNHDTAIYSQNRALWKLLLSCVCEATSLILTVVAVYILPLSFAMMIISTYPTMQLITSFLFTSQKLKQVEIFGVLLFACGVVCFVKPDFMLLQDSTNNLVGLNIIGVSMGLMASLLKGLSYTVLSTLSEQSVVHINICTGILTCVISFVMIPILKMTISKLQGADLLILLALGVATFVAYAFIYRPYNEKFQTQVRIALFIPIIIVLAWDVLLFHSYLSTFDLIGFLLFCLSLIVSVIPVGY